jgi:primosomal replication protein N
MISREPLRYTPAGIPVIDVVLAHGSQQLEGGHARQVEFEMPARFAADQAQRIERLSLGCELAASGFLAPRRKGSSSLRLHVTAFAQVEHARS